MAFKRNIDRLPIIPADAKKHNVTCHYCIVGCGYNAYTWPVMLVWIGLGLCLAGRQDAKAQREYRGSDRKKEEPADPALA